MPELFTIIFMMVAPTASDIDVENHSYPLSMYTSMDECTQALGWINEHRDDLDRHIWCSK